MCEDTVTYIYIRGMTDASLMNRFALNVSYGSSQNILYYIYITPTSGFCYPIKSRPDCSQPSIFSYFYSIV